MVQLQRWRDLLFVHWRYPAEIVQRLLPTDLTVETREGSAWVAAVPFSMERIRPRGVPPIPGISWFLELNLRTYAVDSHGHSGVWFIALEANQRIATEWGRRFFDLPYHYRRMRRRARDDRVEFRSEVIGRGLGRVARFDYTRPTPSELRRAAPGTLDEFLLERYLLFAKGRGEAPARHGWVHHAPYEFATPVVHSWNGRLFERHGLPAPASPPDHVAWSPGADVEVLGLRRPGD